ncbi:MAG: hypothetical protein KZQ77_06535 [Candidatus Thiodiazotropha sp. (ex Notomyrtea botanica)]|nr:hypothetical protein [Candidatus Thiodiazotropha sp. (ex Notomyrtea botanica)]
MNTQSPEITTKPHVLETLIQTRGVFLDHLLVGQITPGEALRNTDGHVEVTYWEELLCAVINPDAGRLMAVVDIHQPNGYSGLLRRHGSIEYVRFFIDWGTGEGYESVSLTHFKVSDLPPDTEKRQHPIRRTVSVRFDENRYWGCVLDGIQPKVRAVLSWNQVPEIHPSFTPLFGNAVESRICVKSEEEMKLLFGQFSKAGERQPKSMLRQECYHSPGVAASNSDMIL